MRREMLKRPLVDVQTPTIVLIRPDELKLGKCIDRFLTDAEPPAAVVGTVDNGDPPALS